MASSTSFCNVSVSSTIRATLEDDYAGWTSEQLVLEFVEASGTGLKVSFSFKESKKAYCVALTLPDTRSEGDFVCATFWSDELFDALLEAHIIYAHFAAHQDGFYGAKSRLADYEKNIAAQIRRFNQEGDTPIRSRIVP